MVLIRRLSFRVKEVNRLPGARITTVFHSSRRSATKTGRILSRVVLGGYYDLQTSRLWEQEEKEKTVFLSEVVRMDPYIAPTSDFCL